MKLIRRVTSLLTDSPTYGPDRARLTSAVNVGLTGLLLNAGLLIMLMPIMLSPDDADIREITESVDFGNLLAIGLLGGATALATLLIPFRMAAVLFGPRTNRYFDQLVLSGMTPARYLLGKALVQNFQFGLILFLMLPWLVLSTCLGGINWARLPALLSAVWLFCNLVALVMLCLTLLMNDFGAAVSTVVIFAVFAGLGCIPVTPQPFLMTPMPLLVHGIFDNVSAVPLLSWSFTTTWLLSMLMMSACCVACVLMLKLGPLYGIIRDNSTFGEVVLKGDSGRKKWLRIRPHIQRPSELAFFYQNEHGILRRFEGTVRTGLSLLLVSGFVFGATALIGLVFALNPNFWNTDFPRDEVSAVFFGFVTALLSFSLVFASYFFSHPVNTVFQKLPIFGRRMLTVSAWDWCGFLLSAVLTVAAAGGIFWWVETALANPQQSTLFNSANSGQWGWQADWAHVARCTFVVIPFCGLTFYLWQRYFCLSFWTREGALVAAITAYGGFMCFVPLLFWGAVSEFPQLFPEDGIGRLFLNICDVSPLITVVKFWNNLPPGYPPGRSIVPFFAGHAAVCLLLMWGIHRSSVKLRKRYIQSAEENDQ